MPEILLSEKKICSYKNLQAQHFQRERSRRRAKEAVFRKQEDQGQVPRPLNPRGLTSKEKAGITAAAANSHLVRAGHYELEVWGSA
jgi:hypothetical protein